MAFLSVLTLIAMIDSSSPGATPAIAHADYRFGYNTAAAESGPGTGTMSVDIGPAMPDGGVMISATDNWWNSVRSRATNSCEVYPNGNVSCLQRPYDLSPMQLVLFPMLGSNYFHGLGDAGNGSWTQSYRVSRGDIYLWDCVFTMTGSGLVKGANSVYGIDVSGSASQIGGHYRSGDFKQHIDYDREVGLPAIVQDEHARLPQTSVYNRDYVELRLIGATPAKTG
jgi:hypothetical protein